MEQNNSKEFKRIENPHTKIQVKPGPKRDGHAKVASNIPQNQVINKN